MRMEGLAGKTEVKKEKGNLCLLFMTHLFFGVELVSCTVGLV